MPFKQLLKKYEKTHVIIYVNVDLNHGLFDEYHYSKSRSVPQLIRNDRILDKNVYKTNRKFIIGKPTEKILEIFFSDKLQ